MTDPSIRDDTQAWNVSFAATASVLGFLGLTLAFGAFNRPVQAQSAAFERPPIDYLNTPVNDPVARLARQLETGDAELSYDKKFGYLKSVLASLDVPLDSQTLVFSKTSLQLHRISPRRPRAVYFNDDVYVGFCQNGEVIEFAATDAKQGAIFYTLSQEQDAHAEVNRPKFVRDRGQCLTCHASIRTQNVPGYLIRSVFSDAAGRPKLGSGTFTTDHTSDFRDRWGGWYVSGDHGDMRHMGNAICNESERTFDRDPGANQASLDQFFRTEHYLTPHSDIVALMVAEHQTQMHNAIAAANFETRQALHQSYQMNELLERPAGFISDSANRRINGAADQVVKYLLMCDEFRLTSPVKGVTDFAKNFAAKGKQDRTGRSLRDFDLKTRLFRFPCSYLIYSDAFQQLPEEVATRIHKRLIAILENGDKDKRYAHLTSSMRKDILEILRQTHPAFERHTLTTQQQH